MSRRSCVQSSLTVLALLCAVPAVQAQQAQQAQPQRGHGRDQPTQAPDWMQQAPPPRGNDGASEAVRRAERDSRGEVLSVDRVQYDGRDMHRVKVVDDHGRVRVYMQDSGRGGSRRSTSSQNDGNGD